MPDKPLPTVWRTAKGDEIPLSQLSPEHLQAAYNYAEQRLLHHWTKEQTFESLLDALEQEARQRGFEPLSIDQQKQVGVELSNRRIVRASRDIGKK